MGRGGAGPEGTAPYGGRAAPEGRERSARRHRTGSVRCGPAVPRPSEARPREGAKGTV
ncbi:hypothetical protein SXIM_23100 [Streptomyces xiamenensis]|uniref:Uncharacterized protein n=1 Tax=Streptomyces xiamenensis TaxID=408015 RepID=A0A0F7FV31_9ACTN|nr:hypothetical protein SXIM_23100 [Streptomyces xiamenensis]